MASTFEDVAKKRIIDRAEVCKKIKADDIAKTVELIFEYIRYFNSIQEFDNHVFDYKTFDMVTVPNEFADFIIPKSVKLEPGVRQSTDVLVREARDKEFSGSLEGWVDLIVRWRQYFKKDILSDVTSLASIKVDKSITDVLNKSRFLAKEGKEVVEYVRYDSTPFIPITLAG